MKITFLLSLLICFLNVSYSVGGWEELIKLNEDFKKLSKPLKGEAFEKIFESASVIMEKKSTDALYQKEREEAFAKNFTHADEISNALKPLFDFDFGGDSDWKQLSSDALYKATGDKTAERELLDLYKNSYPMFNFTSGKVTCMFSSLSVPETKKEKKTKAAKAKLLEQWKKLDAKFKTTYVKSFVKNSVRCLE